MRQDIELTAFTKGELSPRLKGRTDYKGYYEGCETVLNMVPLPQGGATRRPGTLYCSYVKNQSYAPHLVRFIFSVTQAYMLEFGPNYIRVYKDQGQVTNALVVTGAADNGSGLIRLTVASTAGLYTGNTVTVASVGGVPAATGTWTLTKISSTTFDLVGSAFAGLYTSGGTATVIVEIPTNYAAADITGINFTQSADTLYLCHPTYPPATLSRSSHTNWTLSDITFLDGPYLKSNEYVTTTTLALSATTGSVTVTASATTGINGGDGFKSTDVGRLIRFYSGTLWNWLLITAFTDTTHVTATIQTDVLNGASSSVGAGTATVKWRLGKWSATTGYPWLPTFWQQRLMIAGTNNEPNAREGSQTGDFVNFAPTKSDGSVVDTNALSWIVSDDQVNAARWISSAGSAQAMQLAVGTDGSEEIMQAATTSQALTPTSVQVYRETTLGAVAYATPWRINKAVLFWSANGRKQYEWQFNWQVNGYQGLDKTVDSEHISRGGVVDTAYQKTPYGILWSITGDGRLIGVTYLPEQQVVAWHQHQLGGDYYGGNPLVESISTIPNSTGTADEVWFSVLRTINGSAVRTIEVMSPFFDDMHQEQGVFMDCSLSSALVSPSATVTPSTMTGSVTLTATAGTPFAAGNVGSIVRLNGGIAVVTGYTSSTVLTATWLSDATNKAPATSGNWTMTPQYSSFSGLSHLEGQTVRVLGDGADFGKMTVTSATATLPVGTASYAKIGLPIFYRLTAMPFEPVRAAAANTQGRIKRIDTMWLRLLESLGCDIGVKQTDPMTQAIEYKTEALETRSAADSMGQAPPLFTGIYRLKVPGGFDQEAQLNIEGDGPYPLTVLAMIAKGDVGEMPGPG